MYIHKYANYKDSPMIKLSTIDAYMLLKEAGMSKPTVEQINMVKEGGIFDRALGHIGNAFRGASSKWRGLMSRGLGGARKKLIDVGVDSDNFINRSLGIFKGKADDVIRQNADKSKFIKRQIKLDKQFSNAGMLGKADSVWNTRHYKPGERLERRSHNRLKNLESETFDLERNMFKKRFMQHSDNDFYRTLAGDRMSKLDAIEKFHPAEHIRGAASGTKGDLDRLAEFAKEKAAIRAKAKSPKANPIDEPVPPKGSAASETATSGSGPANETASNSTLWGDLKADYAKRPDLYKGLGIGAGAMYVADSRRAPW